MLDGLWCLNDICVCSYRNWHALSDHYRQRWNVDWLVVLASVCRRPADRYRQWSSLLRPAVLWSLGLCLVMLGRTGCLSWATETISTHLGRHCIAYVWTLYVVNSFSLLNNQQPTGGDPFLYVCAVQKVAEDGTIVTVIHRQTLQLTVLT